MKLSFWGWKIEISKEAKELKVAEPQKEMEIIGGTYVEFLGEVIPGYETFEGELQQEEDSVEECEWREEQNWLNKRKQKDGTI
jgi:hypothetical protein